MFQQHLESLTQKSDNAIAALLVGFDGVVVDVFTKPQIDFDPLALASESTYFMNQLRKSSTILHLGALEEASFRTERWDMLLHIINEHYFLILVMNKTGFLGKGRFFLSTTALQLKGELHHELPYSSTFDGAS